MIRAVLLSLALIASAVFGPGIAYAQTGGPIAFSGLAAINKIVMGTPGMTTLATGGNVTVSAAATETVALASGLRIPIATTAASAFTAARLGGLAATAMKAGTFIGAATIILPLISNATGIVVCPPPQFFCKPDSRGPAPSDMIGHYVQTAGGTACRAQADNCSYTQAAVAHCAFVYPTTFKGAPYTYGSSPSYDSYGKQHSYYFFCNSSNGLNETLKSVNSPDVSACPDGYYLSGGQCVSIGAQIPLVDAPASDITSGLTTPLQTTANLQNVADAARMSNVAVIDATSPVTVTAPAVTTQPVTKTETVTNPDGSTSTVKTVTQTTVSPVVAGTTVSNTTITYPATTTVTTTNTNNSTGAVTVTNYTINEYAAPDTPEKNQDLPDDYNREATQRRIEADLNTDGAAKLPDQTRVITAAQTDSDTKMGNMRNDATNGMPADENRFWNFLFAPPSGTCSPFTVVVHGFTGTMDICPWVAKLQELLAWLMALGTAFAVWNNMMKGTD